MYMCVCMRVSTVMTDNRVSDGLCLSAGSGIEFLFRRKKNTSVNRGRCRQRRGRRGGWWEREGKGKGEWWSAETTEERRNHRSKNGTCSTAVDDDFVAVQVVFLLRWWFADITLCRGTYTFLFPSTLPFFPPASSSFLSTSSTSIARSISVHLPMY